jgi:thioredoxin 1
MSNVIFMDFFAEWCIPCDVQDQIVEKLKEKYGNNVEFKKIDIDKDGEFAEKYKVSSIPMLIIEKDGVVLTTHVGITSLEILVSDINRALNWAR